MQFCLIKKWTSASYAAAACVYDKSHAQLPLKSQIPFYFCTSIKKSVDMIEKHLCWVRRCWGSQHIAHFNDGHLRRPLQLVLNTPLGHQERKSPFQIMISITLLRDMVKCNTCCRLSALTPVKCCRVYPFDTTNPSVALQRRDIRFVVLSVKWSDSHRGIK